MQTNKLAQGIATNWVDVPGSAVTNQMTLPMNQDPECIVYRMTY